MMSDGSTKTVQHSINNISRNIGAVFFFKLGTRNVHYKRKIMTPKLLPWQHSWLQSLSVKYRYFQPFKVGQRVLPRIHMVPILS